MSQRFCCRTCPGYGSVSFPGTSVSFCLPDNLLAQDINTLGHLHCLGASYSSSSHYGPVHMDPGQLLHPGQVSYPGDNFVSVYCLTSVHRTFLLPWAPASQPCRSNCSYVNRMAKLPRGKNNFTRFLY